MGERSFGESRSFRRAAPVECVHCTMAASPVSQSPAGDHTRNNRHCRMDVATSRDLALPLAPRGMLYSTVARHYAGDVRVYNDERVLRLPTVGPPRAGALSS